MERRLGAILAADEQDDIDPPDVFLRAIAIRHDRLEASAIRGGNVD